MQSVYEVIVALTLAEGPTGACVLPVEVARTALPWERVAVRPDQDQQLIDARGGRIGEVFGFGFDTFGGQVTDLVATSPQARRVSGRRIRWRRR